MRNVHIYGNSFADDDGNDDDDAGALCDSVCIYFIGIFFPQPYINTAQNSSMYGKYVQWFMCKLLRIFRHSENLYNTSLLSRMLSYTRDIFHFWCHQSM